MCGIVAVITPDRNFPVSVIRAMRDRMIHRGPDGEGEWLEQMEEGTVAFGHRRLSIIDLTAGGAQPMASDDGRYMMVYNGELYNYVELRNELIAKGHRFRTESDSEVLLKAYQEWGYECLPKFNGMFSFCIWDKREKKLFCARDRFGEKPFYMTRIPGGGVAIASEIKSFFGHPAIIADKADNTILDFLRGANSYSRPETFFKNVFRLPAAHAVVFNAKGEETRRWRYWTPDYNQIHNGHSEKEMTDQFRELLMNAVKLRLRSDVRVGACLSGGLDSSTIVGMLNIFEKEGLTKFTHTYSARFDKDPTISEGNFIDEMNDRTAFSSQSVTPDPVNLMQESERLHYHQEQPFLSPSMYLEWCVVRKARQTGTIVMLDGQGADEVLGGYQYHLTDLQIDDLINGHWRSFTKNTVMFNRHLKNEMRKYESSHRRIDANTGFNTRAIGIGISNFIKKNIYIDDRPGIPVTEKGSHSFRQNLAKGLLYDTLPNNLHSADCNGMAHTVETRFPFLDYNFVDWCLKLPNDMLINNGWLKYILRNASSGIVPESIRWRGDKVGFAAPQDRWLREEMRDWARERLFDGPLSKLPEFNKADLEQKWKNHESGQTDNSWNLWKYISLSEWLSSFENGTWQQGMAPTLTPLGKAA